MTKPDKNSPDLLNLMMSQRLAIALLTAPVVAVSAFGAGCDGDHDWREYDDLDQCIELCEDGEDPFAENDEDEEGEGQEGDGDAGEDGELSEDEEDIREAACIVRCIDEFDDEIEGEECDDDGIPDDLEELCNTSPHESDTDGDGILDGDEDGDGDGYTCLEEIEAGTDPADGSDHPSDEPVDSDGDGASDEEEEIRGCDPDNPDTDGDGESDGEEIDCGSSPLDPFFTCEGLEDEGEGEGEGEGDGEGESEVEECPIDPDEECACEDPPA